MRVLSLVRRARLFVRDWTSEWGIAWSIARYRDCERNGGHRWGEPHHHAIGLIRSCSRCGTGEGLATTSGTATTTVWNVNAESSS